MPLAKKTAMLNLGTCKWSMSCEIQKPLMIRNSAVRLRKKREAGSAIRGKEYFAAGSPIAWSELTAAERFSSPVWDNEH